MATNESAGDRVHSPEPGVVLQLGEARRLAALRSYRILDTPPEEVFNDLVRLAAQICAVPTAIVSLVDRHRCWFKAVVGGNVPEKPRHETFCPYTVLERRPVIIHDAREDERFRHLSGVTQAPFIRFYAGYPLETRSGQVLGALCVMDGVPRTLTPAQDAAMRTLVHRVMSELELRKATLELEELQARQHETEARLLDRRALESMRLRIELSARVSEEVAEVSRTLQMLSTPEYPDGGEATLRRRVASLQPRLERAVEACSRLALRLTEGILLQEGWSAALESALRSVGDGVVERCRIDCRAEPEEMLGYAGLFHLFEIARLAAAAALARNGEARVTIALATLGPNVLLQIDSPLVGAGDAPLLPDSTDHTTAGYHARCLGAALDIQTGAPGNFVVRCVAPRSALH